MSSTCATSSTATSFGSDARITDVATAAPSGMHTFSMLIGPDKTREAFRSRQILTHATKLCTACCNAYRFKHKDFRPCQTRPNKQKTVTIKN